MVKFIDQSGIKALLATFAADGYDVYAPTTRRASLHLAPWKPNGAQPAWAWNPHRLPESLKSIFLPTGCEVVRWTSEGPVAAEPAAPRVVMGAKACDLQALHILDQVLCNHEYKEPTWCQARRNDLVISGDCTDCAASCFCTMMGDTPFATAGFDINLSPVDGGFLVAFGSKKAEELLDLHPALFRDATAEELSARDENRGRMTRKVREQNKPWPTKDPFAVSVEKNTKTRIWGRLAATCVECNACNTVCPTCHCFMLLTVPTEEGSARYSLWDSCFQSGYARMAGGGTPRLQLTERFRNHYLHKFVAFPRNWGVTACSGCGRCIDACMGRIDKRECLHRLETEWIPSDVLAEME